MACPKASGSKRRRQKTRLEQDVDALITVATDDIIHKFTGERKSADTERGRVRGVA